MSLQLGETFSGFKIQRPLQWVLRTHSLPCRRSQGFVRRSWPYATLLPTKEKERSVTTLKTAVWQTILPHKHLLIWVAKFLSHCLQNQQELACRLSEKQSALLKSRCWQTHNTYKLGRAWYLTKEFSFGQDDKRWRLVYLSCFVKAGLDVICS